jgi:O-antigen/teichoic acid export membrane protein
MSTKVLKNSIIYIVGDILNKSVPFLMLPILTRYLTPEDYGMIAGFSSFVGFLTIFIGLSLHGAVNVAFFKLKKEDLKVYVTNALMILGVTASIVFFILLLFDSEISSRLLLEKEWLYIAILVSFSQFITLLNTTLWIAEQNSKAYTTYQLAQTVLITSLTIALVVGFGFNWEGQVMASIVSAVSFALISLVVLQKRNYFTFKYKKNDIKELLNFGLPMVPHQLAGWLQTSGDRILLLSMVGASATGLFTIGFQIGMILSVITTAFNKAWTPYLYKLLGEESLKNKIKIVKFTYIYFMAISILVLILYFVSELIFKYFLDPSFSEGMEFVIYILIANGLNGMYYMVVNYLFYVKKTALLAKITFSIALLHIVLSYFMIGLFGAIGVAYVGVVSLFLTFIIVWYVSDREYSMPWLYWRYND